MLDDQFYSGQTKVYWCCDELLKGREISCETEIREVRGWRLGAIIYRLKSDYGWPILTTYRRPDNVAFYRLSADANHSGLRFPPSASALANKKAAQ